MRRLNLLLMSRLHLASAALLMGRLTSALAQSPNRGIFDDWTHHHVIFSTPGTEEDAIRNGKHEQRLRIVSDPRYRMHWYRPYLTLGTQGTGVIVIGNVLSDTGASQICFGSNQREQAYNSPGQG